MTTTVLVTGGAGYIGSHTTRQLIKAGFNVLVMDNLYSGHRWAVDPEAQFFEIDVGDSAAVDQFLRHHPVDAVVHFAGHIVVSESVSNPMKYYRNNTVASTRLIQACRKHAVNHFLFSSSAAVYGEPEQIPIKENTVKNPINPYGRSKLFTEWTLRDVAHSSSLQFGDDFRYLALRYFNVAGACLDTKLGQATPESTHIIKVACEAAYGKRDSVQIFGRDYPTTDGTCIRDYIHVEDLAAAHVAGLKYLLEGGKSTALNCGYGRGFSVQEVVDTVRHLSPCGFKVTDGPRRVGDPAQLVADSSSAVELLGWQPRYDDLELICKTALAWEKIQGQNPV